MSKLRTGETIPSLMNTMYYDLSYVDIITWWGRELFP